MGTFLSTIKVSLYMIFPSNNNKINTNSIFDVPLGAEYIAMVEFAPNQKIAVAKENKKRDPKINTIDQDPDYLKFLEMLENAPEGTGNTVEQTLEEIERKEKEMSDKKMTPLLLFMKEKGEEKKKKREEQREQVCIYIYLINN